MVAPLGLGPGADEGLLDRVLRRCQTAVRERERDDEPRVARLQEVPDRGLVEQESSVLNSMTPNGAAGLSFHRVNSLEW